MENRRTCACTCVLARIQLQHVCARTSPSAERQAGQTGSEHSSAQRRSRTPPGEFGMQEGSTILFSTQHVHASSLTTWENAYECKRARVQPGYADADVRCACADETFAANLIGSFSVKWSGARAVSIAPLVMSCTRVYSTELDSIHMAGMCM